MIDMDFHVFDTYVKSKDGHTTVDRNVPNQ